MTRVLVIAPAYPLSVGGAETYIHTVSEDLAARGHQVLVLTDRVPGTGPRAAERRRLVIRRLHGYAARLTDPTKLAWEQMQFALLGDIEDAMAEEGFDPEVVFTNQGEAAVLGTFVKLQYGIPLVSTFSEQNRETYPLGPGRLRFLYQALPIDRILVGSRFYRDKALAFGADPGRVQLVYHGIDPTVFTPSTDTGRARGGGAFRIGLAGRIAPRKRQDLAVQTVALLARDGFDVALDLAGAPHSSEASYVEALHRHVQDLGLGPRVRFLGAMATAEMPGFYRSLDLCIQPSTEEGLGLAVIEASLCGTPVLAADVVGLREVFEGSDAAHRSLVAGGPGVWAAAIAGMIGDPGERENLAWEQRRHALAAFGAERMLEATEQAIVGTTRGRPA